MVGKEKNDHMEFRSSKFHSRRRTKLILSRDPLKLFEHAMVYM